MDHSMAPNPSGKAKHQNDVNCLRRYKRDCRRWIGWNKCPMRYQLRVHLFTLFGCFFMAFFIFLALYSKFFYQQAVVDNLSTEWPKILEDRLLFSSHSVSTTFYMADKAFIDTLVRLSKLYEGASKDPFPIKTDAYRGVTEDDIKGLSDGMALYGLNPYCDFPSADKEKYKAIYRLHQVWE